jgi:ubiquinone biosynthesis protein UbiJ
MIPYKLGDRTVSKLSSERVINPASIGHALQRLISEIGSLRDDLRVLTATIERLDNSQGRFLEEIDAMHSQHARLASRVRRLAESCA